MCKRRSPTEKRAYPLAFFYSLAAGRGAGSLGEKRRAASAAAPREEECEYRETFSLMSTESESMDA